MYMCVCMYMCIKQRTTSLFQFMIQQLCYSRQNKTFLINGSLLSNVLIFLLDRRRDKIPNVILWCWGIPVASEVPLQPWVASLSSVALPAAPPEALSLNCRECSVRGSRAPYGAPPAAFPSKTYD